MSIEMTDENVKVAVAMRTARAALGINQQELADDLGVAKSTIARIETMEMQPKVDLYLKALKYFKEAGIDVDSIYSDNITVNISTKALNTSKQYLMDEDKRRSDKKKAPKTKIME
ncbi:helix-turn-helix transcriptional regulator [Ferrovum myxofaciens]|jgi:DNA-binding XRE family transcriptional regulator|uniref:helix-turn-helix transcriptional regulator n=1 Tax=Ferrovum myxofaciens TaxID=416213 RepID=UPI0004E27D02|nr:helix-turn-helix transcriptional regulator [Ferrovum myxofaciens]MBU6993424.1 helix-turn-helix transcriptional regulator [Ferrovum myxofaciens]